jgi:hypothetical protein
MNVVADFEKYLGCTVINKKTNQECYLIFCFIGTAVVA